MKRSINSLIIALSLTITSACIFQAEDHSLLPLTDQLLYVGATTGELPPVSGARLQVMSVQPADGRTDATLNPAISISFNKSVVPECIKVNTDDMTCSGTLQVSSDGFATCVRMNTTIDAADEGRTFTATPFSSLANSTAYRIRVRNDVIDLNDSTLGTDYTTAAGFTTIAAAPAVKKTFLTSSVYDGNLGSIAGADAKCMADANYPGSGAYKALITDGVNRIASVSANAGDGQVDWVLAANTTYYRADGTTPIMTTNAHGLFAFGSLSNSFGSGISFISTGLSADWTTHTDHCSGWASTTGNGRIGWGNVVNSQSIDAMSGMCNFVTKVLVCVEQ